MNATSRACLATAAADLAAIREQLAPFETEMAGDDPAARRLAAKAAATVRALILFISETPANRKVIAQARLRVARVGFPDEPTASFAMPGHVCERLLVAAAAMLYRAVDLEAATSPGAGRTGLYGIIRAFGGAVGDLSKTLAQIQ